MRAKATLSPAFDPPLDQAFVITTTATHLSRQERRPTIVCAIRARFEGTYDVIDGGR
jgi:hypothetical protein